MTPRAILDSTSSPTSYVPVQRRRLGQRSARPSATPKAIPPRTRSARSAPAYTSTTQRTAAGGVVPPSMVHFLSLFSVYFTPAEIQADLLRHGVNLGLRTIRRFCRTFPVALAWRRLADGGVFLAPMWPGSARRFLEARPESANRNGI